MMKIRHLRGKGKLGLAIIAFYLLVSIMVWTGVLGQDWHVTSEHPFVQPGSDFLFGTNAIGQDIAQRAIQSTKVVFEIGIVVAFLSIMLGGILGCLSALNHNNIVDFIVTWVMGLFDSIPFYLLVACVAIAIPNSTISMQLAMICVFWTNTCRLMRSEVIKVRSLPFIEYAVSTGNTQTKILFNHVIPNSLHILIIQFGLVFVAAIKSEVILTFLGIGVSDGVSWGTMLAESIQDIQAGQYMNFIVASSMLFFLVLGINVFLDSLQEKLNPRSRSD